MSEEDGGLRVSVSVSRKVNLGNYSSADMFLAVSNIEVGATEADIQEAIDTGEIAFAVLEQAINNKVRELLGQRDAAQERRQAARPEPPKPREVR